MRRLTLICQLKECKYFIEYVIRRRDFFSLLSQFFHSFHNSKSLVHRPPWEIMDSLVPRITRRLSRIAHSVLILMCRICTTWHVSAVIMPSTYQGLPPFNYTGHFEYAYLPNLMVGINHFKLNAAFDSHLPSLL